jgi:hypothetical protein
MSKHNQSSINQSMSISQPIHPHRGRTFQDLVHPRVSHKPLQWVVFEVAVAAVQLQCRVAHLKREAHSDVASSETLRQTY